MRRIFLSKILGLLSSLFVVVKVSAAYVSIRLTNVLYTGCFFLVDVTAGGDFLGLCDQKFHINMCPILDGYGVMGII